MWVRVRATVARQLRLADPFAGQSPLAEGAAISREGSLFLADLQGGQSVILRLADEPGLEDEAAALATAARSVHESDTSRLGLR